MFSSHKSLVVGLMFCAAILLAANNARGALGDKVAEYSFPASSLVMHPTQPYMYATIPSQNSIAIINTNTLAVERTIFVGSGPSNLAFSPDGSHGYIANSTSSFVVVFDTQTRSITKSFLIPERPHDVIFGSQNRLFVLGQEHIFQIDATTGASTGPSIYTYSADAPVSIYGGFLEVSPDRNTLYYAYWGFSPSTMYKINILGSSPILVLQTPFGTAGGNGEDLALSHSGSYICFADGAGQNGYQIAKFRTSDFATVGSFNTDAYPRQVAFSPDDTIVFAVHTAGEINVFDAYTFLPVGTIFASGQASELAVDSTGRYLSAGYTDPFNGAFTGTRVFETGHSVSAADFNRDGKPDYVLFNASTRRTAIWYLSNNVFIAGAHGPTLPAGWSVAALGDFNRDGRPDYVLFDAATRQTAIWYLSNAALIGGAYGPTLPAGSSLVAVGDFDGDLKPDYVLFDASTRRTTIWYLNNNAFVSSIAGPSLPLNWQIEDVADFNGDGKLDYLLLNSSTRQTAIWYLNNNSHIGGVGAPAIAPGYKLTGTADPNHDSSPDYTFSTAAQAGARSGTYTTTHSSVAPTDRLFLPDGAWLSHKAHILSGDGRDHYGESTVDDTRDDLRKLPSCLTKPSSRV